MILENVRRIDTNTQCIQPKEYDKRQCSDDVFITTTARQRMPTVFTFGWVTPVFSTLFEANIVGSNLMGIRSELL